MAPDGCIRLQRVSVGRVAGRALPSRGPIQDPPLTMHQLRTSMTSRQLVLERLLAEDTQVSQTGLALPPPASHRARRDRRKISLARARPSAVELEGPGAPGTNGHAPT